MKNITNYVIYHKGCTDGFMSAYIAHLYFSEKSENVEYIPINPLKTPYIENLEGSNIIMIDVVIPRQDLLEWRKKTNYIIVLDHHITNEIELSDLKFCHFDNKKCGATLAWEYFFPGKPLPWWVKYNQERDLGYIYDENMECLPLSKAVNAYILNLPMTFTDYDILLSRSTLDSAMNKGWVILSAQNVQVQFIMNSHILCDLIIDTEKDKYIYKNIPTINSPILQSELGEILLKEYPESDFCCIYHVLKYNNQLYIKGSLRTNKNNINVGQISKILFGNGGHKKAGGFYIPFKKWLEIVKNSKMKISKEID